MGYNLVGASRIESGIEIDGVNVDDHSIQAMIELIYLDAGNEIMVTNMVKLDQALDSAKDAMDILQSLQAAKNMLSVTSRDPDDFEFEGDEGGDVDNDDEVLESFNDAASSFFGSAIYPTVSDDQAEAAWEIIEDNRSKLNQLIKYLSENTPEADRADSASLYSRLKTVKSHLPEDEDDVEDWILDNYDKAADPSSSTAGDLQQEITFAISAAQNFNDSQKEAVNRYLFVFEEYYKSAGAILQKINDIITHIAQNIAR